MENLKETLFEQVYMAFFEYRHIAKMVGKDDAMTEFAWARFCGMWSVVEAADIEGEYESWKAAKGLK